MENKTCYAVLWIPTFTHKPFIEHPIKETIRRNISDLEDEKFEIEVSLLEDNHIGISVLGDNGEKKDFLRLTCIGCSRNGLIEYSYEETHLSNAESDGFQFTSEVFPEAIYHIIKEFYHEHEFHDNEADTSLRPYISKKSVNLQQNDNPALEHYLERYEEALTDLVDLTRDAKNKIAEDSKKKKGCKEWLLSWLTLMAAQNEKLCHYQSLGKLIMKAKGFEIYLNALYGSIYNTKCKVCACNNGEPTQSDPSKKPTLSTIRPIWNTRYIKWPSAITRLGLSHRAYTEPTPAIPNDKPSSDPKEDQKEDPQKDMRRRAFNIESLIKYFNACYQEYNQQNLIEQIDNARKATRLALIGIFVTIILSIFSLWASYHFSNSSSEPQNKETAVNMDVNAKMDSLQKQIKALTNAVSTQADKSKNSAPDSAPKRKQQ